MRSPVAALSLSMATRTGVLLPVCDSRTEGVWLLMWWGVPQVGPEEHVVCALSGGVDSTVAATLVHKVLGERLHCVFVDNGLLRYKARHGGFM